MKEMTSLNVIESNGNLTMTRKRNSYFPRTIMRAQKNFTMAGKLKKNGLPGRCWIAGRCDVLLKIVLIGKIGKKGKVSQTTFTTISATATQHAEKGTIRIRAITFITYTLH